MQLENYDTQRNFESVESLKGEFLSSMLHLLPLIHPIVYLFGSGTQSCYVRIPYGTGSITLNKSLFF